MTMLNRSDAALPADTRFSDIVYLSSFFSPSDIIGIAARTWMVRLQAREIRDGRYRAWIERGDP
jgi:hypothetical protein